MPDIDQLFEADRPRLRAIAHRMLGSATEADDVVQEVWLRLRRTDAGAIDNLAAWLTTVTGRLCLDVLRRHTVRREQALDVSLAGGPGGSGPLGADALGADPLGPEDEAVRADAVGAALLVVLDTLTPAERLAFVLHDLFAVSFDEIAPIVGRSPEAARQLASRARRRVRARPATAGDGPAPRPLIDAFLTAARGGDVSALLGLLDPDVTMRAGDRLGPQGAASVARFFAGKAASARPALIGGTPAVAVIFGDEIRYVLRLTAGAGLIREIEVVDDPVLIAGLGVTLSS